jgi:polar amino acid transport system ATP-binding protein
VAHRTVFMHQGLLHEEGPSEALFSAPQTAELRQFLSGGLT